MITNDIYHNKVKNFLDKKSIDYEQLFLKSSCHSIDDAVLATGEKKEHFVKNVCMIDDNNNLIVAIVLGSDRASTKRVAKALSINRPRIATPEEVFDKTGYVAGGVPSFSYDAQYIIDEKVMNQEFILTGGGSEFSLIKLKTKDLLTLNNGKIFRIRK